MINLSPRSLPRPPSVCILGHLKEVALTNTDSQWLLCAFARVRTRLLEEVTQLANRWD